MTEELKTCPFCGAEAEMRIMTYGNGKWYGIFCKADLSQEFQHGHFIDNYLSKQEAINAWNGEEINHD